MGGEEAAAERLAKLRLLEKAKELPADPHADVAAIVAAAEAMNDAELEEYLAEFVKRREAAGESINHG
jgi:hypothetical protein